MRLSKLLAPTLREDPKEAEVVSHKLMLRAGYIKKLAAGVYEFLPLGIKTLLKVQNIVRSEMNRAGAQEVFLPTLLPAELWQETGRWGIYGKELFRIKDRHDREFCLGPTHEEIITDLARTFVNSYKQVPINLYQIQTKFRDEIRPRFGLMRGREFMMKDAYSFHATAEDLDREYQNMYETYCRIFDRLGLKYKVVEADSGAIGGGFSQEFMVLADSGEEEVFFCDQCNYTASRDSAGIGTYIVPGPSDAAHKTQSQIQRLEKVSTPGKKTIEEVSAFMKIKPQQMIKTLIYITEKGPVAALVRGDHELNEAKLKRVLGVEELGLADEKTIENVTGAPVGFAGPVNLKGIIIVADHAVIEIEDGVTGANEKDSHFKHVVVERDYHPEKFADLRFALKSDNCPRCAKGKLEVTRGIEVGHIFKLGTKYSDKMHAVFLDEKNQEHPFIMGCYGIGVSRVMSAAIEQKNDKDGIVWPASLAPYHVVVAPVRADDETLMAAADKIYNQLSALGIEVLLDDRLGSVGVRLKDVDLMGITYKVIVGRSLAEGKVELKERATGKMDLVAVDAVAAEIKTRLKNVL